MSYCTPQPDGNTYEGWHLKSLKVYHDKAEAERVAHFLGKRVFYCEYGSCYHIAKK
jgi:hypothetical protein